MSIIRVRVPATTANLGPGFDTLALALKLYLEVDAREDRSLDGPELKYAGRCVPAFPIPDEENLIIRAALATAEMGGEVLPPFSANVHNDIPMGGGLGSSAAALVAGIHIADRLCHLHLSASQILTQAAALEGHPDNVAAALRGGLTIAWKDQNGDFGCHRLQPHDNMRVIVILPELSLSTEEARMALPPTISREDAVFNLQHCAMLVAGFHTGDLDLISRGLEDRLHQPYRMQMAPGLAELLAPRELDGLLGVAISGAGPSVVALAHRNFERIGRELCGVFIEKGIAAEALQLDMDHDGAIVASS